MCDLIKFHNYKNIRQNIRKCNEIFIVKLYKFSIDRYSNDLLIGFIYDILYFFCKLPKNNQIFMSRLIFQHQSIYKSSIITAIYNNLKPVIIKTELQIGKIFVSQFATPFPKNQLTPSKRPREGVLECLNCGGNKGWRDGIISQVAVIYDNILNAGIRRL